MKENNWTSTTTFYNICVKGYGWESGKISYTYQRDEAPKNLEEAKALAVDLEYVTKVVVTKITTTTTSELILEG